MGGQLILDLGEEQLVSSAELRFLVPELAAKRVTVFQLDANAQSLSEGQELGVHQSEKPDLKTRITFHQPTQLRKIGFRFEEPIEEGILMLGEIGLGK